MAGASGHDPEQKDLEFFMLPITSRSYQKLSQKLEDLNLNAVATAITHPYYWTLPFAVYNSISVKLVAGLTRHY